MITREEIISHVQERFLDLTGGRPLGNADHIMIGYAVEALIRGRLVRFMPFKGRVLIELFPAKKPEGATS